MHSLILHAACWLPLAAAAATENLAGCSIYGMALMANGPSRSALVRVDLETASVSVLGSESTWPSEECAMGDLSLVDETRSIYYFLGATHQGATLVGLSLKDGSQVCSQVIGVEEIQFVGIGQSLVWDVNRDELVIAGLVNSTNPSHALLRVDASSMECGPSKHAGSFGFADYAPLLHSSTLDKSLELANQTLYTVVAPSQNTIGILQVNLNNQATTLIQEDTPDHTLVGLQFDPHTSKLVGVMPAADGSIELRSFSPATGAWSNQPLHVTSQPSMNFKGLGGNEGSVSTFNAEKGLLYTMLSVAEGPPYFLVQIDVRSRSPGAPAQVIGQLFANQTVGLNTLLQMELVCDSSVQ